MATAVQTVTAPLDAVFSRGCDSVSSATRDASIACGGAQQPPEVVPVRPASMATCRVALASCVGSLVSSDHTWWRNDAGASRTESSVPRRCGPVATGAGGSVHVSASMAPKMCSLSTTSCSARLYLRTWSLGVAATRARRPSHRGIRRWATHQEP